MARVAVTNDHKLGGLSDKSHSSAGEEAKTEASAGCFLAQDVRKKQFHASHLASGGLLKSIDFPWLMRASPGSLHSFTQVLSHSLLLSVSLLEKKIIKPQTEALQQGHSGHES